MTSKQEDENYWNHSDFKPFSFDDDELGSKNRIFGSPVKNSFITDIIFEGVPSIQKPESQKLPLESLLSKQSLNKILCEDFPSVSTSKLNPHEELQILKRQINNQWNPPDISKTIKQIITGQKFSLHLYQSFFLKNELLNEAIKSGDGNSILAVVIFLSKTLKKSLFYQIMQAKPVAISHYVNYLSHRMMISDLIDILEMLGQARDAAMKQFTVIVQGIQNTETKLQRLSTCYNNHFSLLESKDKLLVQDYIDYLKWLSQESSISSLKDEPILKSLTYLCKNHWNESKTSKNSPWYLLTQQNISDRQFQWIILSSRASIQSWDDIETHFLAKGWLSGKKLKSILPIEKIIIELHQHKAPYSILTQYLEVISNFDKRLELAKQLPCHRGVIDALILMKDRQGIIEYKVNLKPQSEDYLHAENALRSQVKWKN